MFNNFPKAVISNHLNESKPLKPVLFAALLFLIACNKYKTTAITKSVGMVNYTIQDSAIEIADTTVGSKAIWTLTSNLSKRYALQAYNSVPGGEVHDMISIFIKTAQLKTGYNYSGEVTGSILRNSLETQRQRIFPELILIYISELSGNQLCGTFTAHLNNLSTNDYFDASGDF